LQAFGSLEPDEWCLSDPVEEIEIRGEGFTDNLDMENAVCTFQMTNNQEFSEYFIACINPNCTWPGKSHASKLSRDFMNLGTTIP
jgi:hypothetical protein